MRVTAEEYEAIDLRAHSLLADVPLHDVWHVELPGGEAGMSILKLRELLSAERVSATNRAVRFLFGLRSALGRLFGWDAEPARSPRESYLDRLTPADREASQVEPGTADGPFQALFVSPRESISEIHNATVHAFSVFALVEDTAGYRLYWAIYVRPVGRITGWYMALIDPFRRWLIYPAVLRHIRASWTREKRAQEREP